jgi:N-acetylglucosaminyldiphosphoundecaprenol N-acetyl-beta-D-mannosaminyltransferase
MRKIAVAGIGVNSLTKEEIVGTLIGLASGTAPKTAFYLNAHCVNVASSDPGYREILAAADLVYAGGAGVVWASRFLGQPLPERVNILDFFDRLAKEMRSRGIRLYLLGGEDSTVQGAAAALRAKGVTVAGAHSGFFDREEDAAIIEQINAAKPDILMVGMGVPKQEKWINAHRRDLDVRLFWGVGAAFDWLSGQRSRAPQWMIAGYLEWLHRLFQQPLRLWKRYLIGNAVFLWRVAAWRMKKARLLRFFLPVIMLDAVVVFFLFSSRPFAHLAIWNIRESGEMGDFYWRPENAPKGFRFEPYNAPGTAAFKPEIYPVAGEEKDDFKKAIKTAAYVAAICSAAEHHPSGMVRWEDPAGLLKQAKSGARLHCFHRAILVSSFLSSLGMKSRLWALENDMFRLPVHTVMEVYLQERGKWVFLDAMMGFYAVENDEPLSFLALRARLLAGRMEGVEFRTLDGAKRLEKLPVFYTSMTRDVFLRSGNDFISRYRIRYGRGSVIAGQLDRAGESIRRGAEYAAGRQDTFIHYVDGKSPRMMREIIAAKFLFYFLAVSSLFVAALCVLAALRSSFAAFFRTASFQK